jgi:hypothetical protein
MLRLTISNHNEIEVVLFIEVHVPYLLLYIGHSSFVLMIFLLFFMYVCPYLFPTVLKLLRLDLRHVKHLMLLWLTKTLYKFLNNHLFYDAYVKTIMSNHPAAAADTTAVPAPAPSLLPLAARLHRAFSVTLDGNNNQAPVCKSLLYALFCCTNTQRVWLHAYGAGE